MEKTPKSWEEGTLPTPEQLADWLNVCTREERIYLAEIILNDAFVASNCRMMAHEALIADLQDRLTTLSSFYRKQAKDEVPHDAV